MPRSYLFVAADQPAQLAAGLTSGADAVVVDLEDAVLPAAKDAARAAVTAWLEGLAPGPRPEIWIRVNAGEAIEDDVRAVVRAGIAGIVVPKAGDVGLLVHLDNLLAICEKAAGYEPYDVAVAPMVETAAGLVAATAIAGAPRVSQLMFGETDLCIELGLSPSPDRRELWPVWSQLAIACAAGSVDPPVAGAAPASADAASVRETSLALHRFGFRSRLAAEPGHIGAIHEVFSASPLEVERAARLVAAHDAAAAEGVGVIHDESGRVIEPAVVRAARRILGQTGRPPA